jgi:hypothetical protein
MDLLTRFFVGLTHMANQFQVKESRHICGCAKKNDVILGKISAL